MDDRIDLFTGTAAYYAKFRRPYPDALFDELFNSFGDLVGSDILDLGSGPGSLARPLAMKGCCVWAADPDVDMLAEGMRLSRETNHRRIRWLVGSDRDLLRFDLPPLRACVMGASFHWMNRSKVLAELDRLILPDGGIALVSITASVWSDEEEEPGWAPIAREVVIEFMGEHRRAGSGVYEHPEQTHEEVLQQSPFSAFRSKRFREAEQLTVQDVVGLQLSTSYASPVLLGERIGAFRDELTTRLKHVADNDILETITTTELIVAKRPD